MRLPRFASIVRRSKYLRRLQLERARFSDFVEALPGSVWETLFTDDGPVNVNFSNPVEVSGYSAEEWKANPDLWLDILHPDDRDRVVNELRRVCEGGGGRMTMRFRWIRKSGDVAWVEVHCIVSVDATGRVTAMRGVTLDVTAERAAQRRLDLLARAVGSTSERIAIIDARDRFVFVNRAFGKAHDYLEEELIGRSVRDVFENWSDLTDPERIGVRPFRSRCRDGRLLQLLVRTSRVPGQNGDVDARILVAGDPGGADLEKREFESILRESEQRFRTLCQAAFDGIMIHENGVITEVSDKCAAMFQATRAEMVGRTVYDVTAPEFHDAVREGIGRESVSAFESVAVRPGGERFPVEVCGVNAPGSPVRVTALRDLTERKRAEEELRIREERFRDLVENSHEMMCTHDLEGQILSANPAAARCLGIPVEELVTMNLRDILAPEGRALWPEYIEAIVRDGEASGRMTVVSRDGDLRVWLYHNSLRKDGPTPIVRGLARDVTEQERAMRALQKSEALFRSIIENASDIIGIVDPAGCIRYHSPSAERVLGYDAGALDGATLVDLVHEQDFHRACEFFERQVVDPAAAYTTELRLRRRDGSWRSFEVATKNVVRNNRVEAIVVNARDVTDRRLLESQLEQANRLNSLGHLAATVAHEFNNVLMGMQPFAELLERPDISGEMTLKCGRYITGSIQRGKRVALDLLRFTQPAAPILKPLRLAEWWERLAPEVEAQCGNAISIRVELPEPSPCVVADGAQLAQVIANLTNNARDAMPRGGRLTIAVREPQAGEVFPFGFVSSPENFVQISCSDSGTGIAPDVMPHLFEPLFTTKHNGGTGLGLAVAHQVISRHGGSIFVESEPGAGSTFHVFVPKFDGDCEEPATESPKERPISARRLLIVDDDEVIVGGVSELLMAEGFEVHAVTNGTDAGEAVRRVGPDVVLLDIGLPDMDGVDLGRQLRGDHPALPIIFATGHGDERVAVMDDGMRLLRKPFEIRMLLDTIADLERIPA